MLPKPTIDHFVVDIFASVPVLSHRLMMVFSAIQLLNYASEFFNFWIVCLPGGEERGREKRDRGKESLPKSSSFNSKIVGSTFKYKLIK